MISSIRSSNDLAVILNAEPLTEADAQETPRNWIEGIWVGGETYPLDADATTDTLAVLANGTAAVTWSPKGTYCTVGHGNAIASHAGHWCDADTDSVVFGDDVRGVTRDWRQVTIWDSNGYTEHQIHDSLDEAKAAFDRESSQMSRDWDDQEALMADDEDEEITVSYLI